LETSQRDGIESILPGGRCISYFIVSLRCFFTIINIFNQDISILSEEEKIKMVIKNGERIITR